ncbi:MAG: maleylpyruvate isomerase family mycothiol-dependent enzyme [Pseudonocardia sp.]
MAMATAERADLLVSLTPAQWEAPTLCDRWRVRDVVAHMFSHDELGPLGTVRRIVTGRLSSGGPNALGVAAYADRSPDQLIALVKDHLRPRGLTAGFGGRIAVPGGDPATG